MSSSQYPSAVTYTFPIDDIVLDSGTDHVSSDNTPIYVPDLETISYADSLYGSEYKVFYTIIF